MQYFGKKFKNGLFAHLMMQKDVTVDNKIKQNMFTGIRDLNTLRGLRFCELVYHPISFTTEFHTFFYFFAYLAGIQIKK